MHKVYSIKKKRYSKKYFVNFVDFSRDSIELGLDVIMKYVITKDSEIDEDTIQQALSEQSLKDAKLAAYNYVSFKPRSEFEVRDKLRTKEYSQDSIDFAITFLFEFKLLNDEKFAQSYIVGYIKNKPSGKYKLIHELRKRGIEESLIDKSMGLYYPDDNALDLAFIAAKKHIRKVAHKPKEKQKQLVTDFLSRRGFDWDTINKATEKLF
jgi:regulatory protein